MQYMRSLEKSTYTVIAKMFNTKTQTLKSNIEKACINAKKSKKKKVDIPLTPKTVTGYVLEILLKN